MIASGITHSFSVLVSVLTAGNFYEWACRHFPELEGVIAQRISPVLERLNVPMPVHTVGLFITAMTVAFIVGVVFRPSRRA